VPFGPEEAVHLRACDPDFPSALVGLTAELWLRGQAASLRTAPRVTVVGSRAASARGLARAQALGRALAAQGALVVSGGALGIDAAAHQGALEAVGLTCAVLGTGVDCVYPSRHGQLFADIARRGCLLSSFPLGTPPRPAHFPQRNHLMAALAELVVVVEAKLQSGTGYTARAARQLGRRVVCFADSPGTAALVQAGTQAVTDVGDVLALVGKAANGGDRTAVEDAGRPLGFAQFFYGESGTAGLLSAPAQEALAMPPLDATAFRVLAAIAPVALYLDEMCARTGLSAADCAAAVVELELRGRCSRLPGGRYIGHAPLC
jgi:DNA processing protein